MQNKLCKGKLKFSWANLKIEEPKFSAIIGNE